MSEQDIEVVQADKNEGITSMQSKLSISPNEMATLRAEVTRLEACVAQRDDDISKLEVSSILIHHPLIMYARF